MIIAIKLTFRRARPLTGLLYTTLSVSVGSQNKSQGMSSQYLV